jgi:hypothetical protein
MTALTVLALAAATLAATAQPPKPPAKPCAAAEFRQFDFWAGTWDVRLPNGKPAGVNRIEIIENGCALQENWTSATGNNGRSLSMYSKDDGKWHQTWVDNGGTLLMLAGTLKGASMVLEGTTRGAKGEAVLNRVTWTPGDDGGLRQPWEASSDGGKTWTVAFDGRYTKKK